MCVRCCLYVRMLPSVYTGESSVCVCENCRLCFFFLIIRRPPRSTLDRSSAASDVYKRQSLFLKTNLYACHKMNSRHGSSFHNDIVRIPDIVAIHKKTGFPVFIFNLVEQAKITHKKRVNIFVNSFCFSGQLMMVHKTEFQERHRKSCRNLMNRSINKLTSCCHICLLYTSPSPRDRTRSRMPSSA